MKRKPWHSRRELLGGCNAGVSVKGECAGTGGRGACRESKGEEVAESKLEKYWKHIGKDIF